MQTSPTNKRGCLDLLKTPFASKGSFLVALKEAASVVAEVVCYIVCEMVDIICTIISTCSSGVSHPFRTRALWNCCGEGYSQRDAPSRGIEDSVRSVGSWMVWNAGGGVGADAARRLCP